LTFITKYSIIYTGKLDSELVMERHYKLVCDYVFSNKSLSDYSACEQDTIKLAIDVLTTHNMGGKFMEKLIQLKYKLIDDGKIHGWDGTTKDNRPVEIKTETINPSKKLFCEASFSPNTKDKPTYKEIFLKELPVFITAGVCDVSGKCIYLMFTDTSKLTKNCKLFDMLGRNAPRVNFGHWINERNSIDIKYKNKDLIKKHHDSFRKELRNELINGLQTSRK